MKNLLYFISLVLILLLSSCSVPNAGSSFYQAHKHKKGVRNFALPGWLIYTGTGFAHDIVQEEEVRVLMQVAKKVKKVQFMLDEGNGVISQAELRVFQQHLHDRQFDDLLYVRSEDTTVSFMVRARKDKLRDLIVLIHADEDFVFLNMRTNIKVKNIAQLIDAIMQLDKQEEEPKPEKPPVEEPIVRPRA